MKPVAISISRLVAMISLTVVLCACSGGGGGDGDNGGGITPPATPPVNVEVSGTVRFDRVPVSDITSGLEYGAIVQSPARKVSVRALNANTSAVLDETVTSDAGRYAVTVPAQTPIIIRARAEMLATGSPAWNYRVVDNTAQGALYVLDSAVFNTGAADSTHNLLAASGWTGSAYTQVRAAAPFAILDDLYEASSLVLGADPDAVFPPLVVNWSVDNKTSDGDLAAGDIGTSFFRRSGALREIYVLGWANNDTDEYDRHVITHEWGHYFEDTFSRSDSVGGPHGQGDVLDPRVAFGEGFGNAFSAMALDDPIYRDTVGARQSFGFMNSVEANSNAAPGWYSEDSIEAILYDLFDAADDGSDTLSLGFGPLYEVLAGAQAEADYFTTIFTFIPALKQQQAGATASIDAIVAAQSMAATDMNARGSTQTNNAGNNDDVFPVYTSVQVDGAPGRICSIGGGAPAFGTINKLSNHRFMEFRVAAAGQYEITATAVADGIAQPADPDMVLYRRGALAIAEDEVNSIENLVTDTLQPGVYLLDVYEYANTTESPRGRTCIDVLVSRR